MGDMSGRWNSFLGNSTGWKPSSILSAVWLRRESIGLAVAEDVTIEFRSKDSTGLAVVDEVTMADVRSKESV
jgi:hypothetical protein